jgi:rod shape-determining protein MreC
VAVSRRTSPRVTLVMLVLISATLLTLDYRGDARGWIGGLRDGARDIFAPVQGAIGDVLRPVGDFFSGAVNYGAAQQENENLQRQNGRLMRELEETGAAERQLSQILAQLHLPWVENVPTVVAQVIDQSPSNFDDEIEIDKGSDDGIGTGMPVVSGAGLVGTIVGTVGAHTALVQLLTDPRSGVGVRFGNNELAVTAGQGPNEPLSLQNVQNDETVAKGDIITTSGLSGAAYPADIPVGTVSEVQSPTGLPTHIVSVVPFVNFSNLQYVSVMQWLPPA